MFSSKWVRFMPINKLIVCGEQVYRLAGIYWLYYILSCSRNDHLNYTNILARNFRGIKFLQIGCWQRFRKNFFAVRRLQSHAHSPYWVYANRTCITRESAVRVSEFRVEAMVRGYNIYEDIWDATVGEE